MAVPLRLLARRIVLPGALLLGAQAAAAQSEGCTSTYTNAGTAAGGAAGLFAEYYPGTFQSQSGFAEGSATTFFSATSPTATRVEPVVSFANQTFGSTGATYNGSGNPVTFSARYRGSIYLKAGAAYTFYLTADDGAYLFLGKEATLAAPTPGKAFIRNGILHTAVTVTRVVTVPRTGPYDTQIIYGQNADASALKLEYSGGPDNLPQQVVPQTALCAGPANESYTANMAPTSSNVANVAINARGGNVTLSPGLSGYDFDGTVASYRILSLPTAGTLSYNGTNLTAASLPYPAADPALLRYNPSTNAPDTYSFQYRAIDNSGAESETATYALPTQYYYADLATTLGAPATAPQGELIYYTATVVNNGPATATGIAVRINLPANLAGLSLSNNGTYEAATGRATYTGFTLAPGASATRSVAFLMPATAINATATATAGSFVDSNAANDVGAAYTGPTQVADVKVAINGPAQVVTSQDVVYKVVATNLGSSTATGITLRAQLPAGQTGVVLSDGGVYNASNGQVVWPAVGSLLKGSTFTRTVQFGSGPTPRTLTAVGSATTTTADGDPVPTNNDGSNGEARLTTAVVSTAATSLCAAPGQDNNATLAAGTVVNTYFPGQGTVAAGARTLTLGPALSSGATATIAAGDLLVIMQMQGADFNAENTDAYGDGILGDNVAAGQLQAALTAGTYEYGVASGPVPATGGTLTLTAALMYGYASANATATSGQRRYQVIRVPQYQNVTLTGTLTAPRWNGLTGGVLVLDANGELDFGGQKIDMAGRGFRGGGGQRMNGSGGFTSTDYRTTANRNGNANKGEGIAGTPRYVNDPDHAAANPSTPVLDTRAAGLLPAGLEDGYPSGDRSRGAPGNAGGGGTDGNPGNNNDENTGGGGGSNSGRGGLGGNSWSSNRPTGGYGGAIFTQATASRLIMGGGGGAGTNNDGSLASTATYPANAGLTANNGYPSSGAAGGGIVLLRAARLSANAGSIDVSGADMNYVPANDGTGGGGAGGSVVLLCNASNNNANSSVLQNITVLANGGKGGTNTGGGSPHGPGGGGGGGIVFSSSVLHPATSYGAGINGLTANGNAFGAGAGTAGTAQTNITRADVPNQIVSCPADVVTTLSASTAAEYPGNTVTFTIQTKNEGPSIASNVVQTITVAPNLATLNVPTNATYNAGTGVVTFDALASMASGAEAINTISFVMPTRTVLGRAAATSGGDLDPSTSNNDGSDPSANVRVAAINDIAGRVFDDVNYGGGRGRDFTTADASAVAGGFASGAIGSANATVELYDAAGTLVQTTTTGPDGSYGFAGMGLGSYTVRVINATVQSARNLSASGVVPVQTFRAVGSSADVNRVGGEAPEKADAAANTGNQTLADLTTDAAAPQSVSTLTLSGAAVEGVDFGFNFSTIVNKNAAGQGSLRQFMLNANALPNLKLAQDASSHAGSPRPATGVETSIFMITNGNAHHGLRNGLTNQLTNGVALISLNTATDGSLPALTDGSTALDGTTQTRNVGNTNDVPLGAGGTVGTAATALSRLNGPEVAVVGTPGQANSEKGLTLAAPGCTVRGLALYGFGNTATNLTGADIYVTGAATSGTVITGNVLGASAASFTDPGAGVRSTGHGIYLASFNSGFVSVSMTSNLVGFHGASGIENMANATPTSLLIQNNEIRGNALGSAATAGVRMGTYGGTVRGNLLTDNAGAGLDAQGTTGNVTAADNTISGNGMAGTLTPGVRLSGSANLVQRNVISGNYGAGVMAMHGAANNVISQNSTFDNGLLSSARAGAATGQLGIDLLAPADDAQKGTAAYATPNADGKTTSSGANGLLNFPIIVQSVVTNTTNGNLEIKGFAPAGAVVELFVADRTAVAFGQGKTYLTSVTEGSGGDQDTGTGQYSGVINGLNQGTESNANRFLFRIPLANLPEAGRAALLAAGARLTATATVASGSGAATSEFSGSTPLGLNQPLPVQLVHFTAQAAGPDARLTWRTAQEVNNDRFVVERSFDGLRFLPIRTVAGQGTTAQAHDYALTDAGVAAQAAQQPVYYRLQQVDTDGQAVYSPVQAVRFGAARAAQLALWPNPTTSAATLDLSTLPSGTYQVQVLDATGRVSYGVAAAGGRPLTLPAGPWPSGVYLVRVQGNGLNQTLRLIKH